MGFGVACDQGGCYRDGRFGRRDASEPRTLADQERRYVDDREIERSYGISHAELVNSGTLIVNGESSSKVIELTLRRGRRSDEHGDCEEDRRRGHSQVGFTVSNEGTISAFSGKLAFAAGGTSGIHGSYSASGVGVGLVAEPNSETLALGSVSISGSASLEVTDGTATTTGMKPRLEASWCLACAAQGTLEVNGISTLQSLTLTGGRVTGAGTVDITGALTAGANAAHVVLCSMGRERR